MQAHLGRDAFASGSRRASHLGRDAFVSGLRGVRIWGEAQLRMGQGTIERWTAFAAQSGSRFFRLLCDKR